MTAKPIVGFIGLGAMGKPMATNIIKKGYPLVVWNRTKEKVKELVELGAKVAETPKEVAQLSDVIITMLATPKVTEIVVFGKEEYQGIGVINGLSPGKILINMATDPPSLGKKIAEELAKIGCEFVDAPVVGSVKPAMEGKLTILAAGRKEVVEKVKPILETMGRVLYVGSTGSGEALKLVLNAHLNIITAAFAEVLALGVKLGLDPKVIVDAFNASVFKTYITETKGEKILKRDWTPAFTIDLAYKDVTLALQAAEEVKAPMPLLSIVKDLYSSAISHGEGSLDYCALVKIYERLANLEIPKVL
jgi:3-hydroxyisobutyrate dehydrogenase-like beta-hydroxyacid dehydrogenase